MFVFSSKPFQLSSYKKANISEESGIRLITSYTCVMSPLVVMVGTVIDKKVLLCKKERSDYLKVDGKQFKISPIKISLQNLVENFRNSDGLDFLILNLQPFFLLTRQPNNNINVFMTTAPNFIEMFTDPAKVFGDYPGVVNTYEIPFNLSEIKLKRNTMKKQKKARNNQEIDENMHDQQGLSFEKPDNSNSVNESQNIVDNQTQEVGNQKNISPGSDKSFSIQIGKTLTDEEFGNFLNENSEFISLKYGNLKDGSINFTRQPLKKLSNSDLVELIDYFTIEEFDYVEILSSTKLAGYKKDNRFIWYAELPSSFQNEYLYINEIVKLMRNFVISAGEESYNP